MKLRKFIYTMLSAVLLPSCNLSAPNPNTNQSTEQKEDASDLSLPEDDGEVPDMGLDAQPSLDIASHNEDTPIEMKEVLDMQPDLSTMEPVTKLEPCIPTIPAQDDHCEAMEGSRCFYVDPDRGSDTNDGSFNAPFRTFANLNHSIWGAYRPESWVGLTGGDVVYLREGTHNAVYNPGNGDGAQGGGNYFIFLDRNMNGSSDEPITIKAYPGEQIVVDMKHNAIPVYINSNHIRLSGFEIHNGWDRGIRIYGDDILIDRMVVLNTDGAASSNVAGIEVHSSSDVEVRYSAFIDNYDRTAAQEDQQTHNSCNAALYSNRGNIRFHHNYFAQTGHLPFSGCGIKYKHSSRQPNSAFELDHNYFENHAYMAIGLASTNEHIHHNVISGAPVAISSQDWGGPTHQVNQLIEHNTIYNARGVYLYPTDNWVDHEGGPWAAFDNVVFKNNIVYDRTEKPEPDNRTVSFNAYLNEDLQRIAIQGASFSNNCYWAEHALSFGIAEQRGGARYNLAEWQSAYEWDLDSIEQDPMFSNIDNREFYSAGCQTQGAFDTPEHWVPTSLDNIKSCQ